MGVFSPSPMAATSRKALRYEGAANFRYRLLCATLAKRPVIIDEIRSDEENIGLRDYEAGFLRLLEKVTNGSIVEINETGTCVTYTPGLIVGGRFTHDCAHSRGIGYFLEALVVLAPFGKKPIVATLRGITNESIDLSIDVIRTAMIPLLKEFGIEDEPEIKIAKRGAPPSGGGSVQIVLPNVKALKAVQKVHAGAIRRIRGLAYSARVSPMFGARMLDSCKAVLTAFTSDVFVYTDHCKGPEAGNSPGYALSLLAETETGSLYSAEHCGGAGVLPEEVGEAAAFALLEELDRGGCVGSAMQPLVFVLMALTPEDVSALRIGTLTLAGVATLRLLKDFFGITFKLEADESDRSVLVSCVGVGFTNFSRVVK
eukprot:Amastigsp_a174597_186.p1 type:complete len:371 gc:universal Amastigsp_a174597_186:1-1113(+)